jgi:hypothetical protein
LRTEGPENNNWYPTQKRLDEPHTRYGGGGEKKNKFLLKNFSLLFCNFFFLLFKKITPQHPIYALAQGERPI